VFSALSVLLIYNTSPLAAKKRYPLLQCDLGWNRCSKGTPITKKLNPSLLSKEEQRKKKKTKVLTQNKYMAMGLSGARCQE
jgi:hypothetical protein